MGVGDDVMSSSKRNSRVRLSLRKRPEPHPTSRGDPRRWRWLRWLTDNPATWWLSWFGIGASGHRSEALAYCEMRPPMSRRATCRAGTLSYCPLRSFWAVLRLRHRATNCRSSRLMSSSTRLTAPAMRLFHPKEGSHPGVLIWPDSLGLRPALRELGKRIAAEGYSALVPNHLYRRAKAPVFDQSFDMNRPEDREEYFRIVDPFLAPGAAERDAVAFVDFLDAQRQVNKRKKIGNARLLPGRRVRAENRGGKSGPRGRRPLLPPWVPGHRQARQPASARRQRSRHAWHNIAIASDDDEREPDAKTSHRSVRRGKGARRD